MTPELEVQFEKAWEEIAPNLVSHFTGDRLELVKLIAKAAYMSGRCDVRMETIKSLEKMKQDMEAAYRA